MRRVGNLYFFDGGKVSTNKIEHGEIFPNLGKDRRFKMSNCSNKIYNVVNLAVING